MKRSLLILPVAALLAASCGNNSAEQNGTRTTNPAAGSDTQTAAAPASGTTAGSADMHNAENALDYQGTYTGTLPAADAPGIETTLDLKKDGTYSLKSYYIDRDTFYTKGTYRVEGNLLTLKENGGQETEYYQIGENKLFRLDMEKQRITGPLAEHYILHKK